MKSARDLPREQLVELVDHIQQVLYLDADARRMIWNPDKEWDADSVDSIAAAMADAGLKPEQKMPRDELHAGLRSVDPDVAIPAAGQETRLQQFFQGKVQDWMNDGEREIVRVLTLWATREGTTAVPRIELEDYLDEYLSQEPADRESQPLTYKLNVNFARLRQQKSALLALIDAESPLMGVVELLDAIQDQAVDVHGVSEKQVFGPAIEE